MKLNYSLIITLISWYFLPSPGLCCQVILYDAEAECTCSLRSESGPQMLAINRQCSHPLIQTFKVKTHSDTRNYLAKLQNFTMGTSTSQSVVTFYRKRQSGERKASIDRMSPAHAPVHISCIFAKQKPPYIYKKLTILKLPKGS